MYYTVDPPQPCPCGVTDLHSTLDCYRPDEDGNSRVAEQVVRDLNTGLWEAMAHTVADFRRLGR